MQQYNSRLKARRKIRQQQQKEVKKRVAERRRQRRKQGLTPDPLPGEDADVPVGQYRWKSPTESVTLPVVTMSVFASTA